MTLAQLKELAEVVELAVGVVEIVDEHTGSRITWDTVNMYHVDPHFVRALTLRFKSSFCELVAKKGPQPGQWFVSHWWGTPLRQTIALLNFHASTRELPPSATYWICTFANNQHDLSDLATDLRSTPFVKALLSPACAGSVAVLDKGVTTLKRVWCVLENYVSTTWAREVGKERHHAYDLAAWLPDGVGIFAGKPVPAKPTLLMDLGEGKMKGFVEDESTGGSFPMLVSEQGVQIDVAAANASRESDLHQILHLIAGTEGSHEGPPPKSCDGYDRVNKNARRMFAPGAMQAAALRGDFSKLQALVDEFRDQVSEGISDGATPLHAAAWKQHMDVLHYLIEVKADTNARKTDGSSPLFAPAQDGSVEAIEALLHARADPDIAREDGVTPLFIAAQRNRVEAASALLEGGATADLRSAAGGTALIVAAQQGYTKMVRALLSGRADPNFASSQGIVPVAVAAKHKAVLQLLKDAGGKLPSSGSATHGQALVALHGLGELSAATQHPALEQPSISARAAAEASSVAQSRTGAKRKAKAKAKGPGTGLVDLYANL